MVELKPREFEALVDELGIEQLNELMWRCRSTPEFWDRLQLDLMPVEYRRIDAALRRE